VDVLSQCPNHEVKNHCTETSMHRDNNDMQHLLIQQLSSILWLTAVLTECLYNHLKDNPYLSFTLKYRKL